MKKIFLIVLIILLFVSPAFGFSFGIFDSDDEDKLDKITVDGAEEGQALIFDSEGNATPQSIPGAGLDDVTGPATSTDEAVPRYNGATGKILQDSSVLIDNDGAMTGMTTVDGRDVSVDGAKLDLIDAGAETNEPLVSQAVAEAGSSEVEYSWSPLRVYESIAAWISANLGTMSTKDDAPSDGTTYGRKDGAWADAGGLTWEVISTNTQAVNGRGYLIDASGGDVTLTAVGTPSTGDIFGISDYTNSANANAITLARNNSGIESKEEDLVIDIDGASFNVVYADADRGWSIDRFVGRHNAVPQSERDALIASYEATGGDSWTDNTGWLDGNFSVNNWFGVTVTDGHVTELSLPDNNLVGAAGNTFDPLISLTSLSCRDNTISVLDVSALTLLTYLNCGNNTISVLDVSALTSLTYLNCRDNTISTLDVSALTSLTDLSCQDNTISILDVSALTSLTYLNCRDNTISILDVSALTLLATLSCYNNTISVLDVSALTSLTSLSCYSNTMIEAEVDNIICDVDVAGATDGTLSIAGTNAAPSAAGLICKGNLETDDWEVDVTAP